MVNNKSLFTPYNFLKSYNFLSKSNFYYKVDSNQATEYDYLKESINSAIDSDNSASKFEKELAKFIVSFFR